PGEADVEVRADGLICGRVEAHGFSVGVASRPRSTISNRKPSACSGIVLSQSKSETRRLRACWSGMQQYIGSYSSNGSPGKDICVTRRVMNSCPNSEK